MTPRNITIQVDDEKLRKHVICRWGGFYIDETEVAFEIRCVARFHGGSNLLVLTIPKAEERADLPASYTS